MKIDERTGGIQILGKPVSPEARELQAKVQLINRILPGIQDPRKADQLGRMISMGVPDREIEMWWHEEVTGVPAALDPNYRHGATTTGPTTVPEAGGTPEGLRGAAKLLQQVRTMNDEELRRQRTMQPARP